MNDPDAIRQIDAMQDIIAPVLNAGKHPPETSPNLQEAIDRLRRHIKYLVFDLEAERREKGYLQKVINESSSPPAIPYSDDDDEDDDDEEDGPTI